MWLENALHGPHSYFCYHRWISPVLLAAAFSIWINGNVCRSQMTMNIWCYNIVLFGTHKSWVIYIPHSTSAIFVYKDCCGFKRRLQRFGWQVLVSFMAVVWLNNFLFGLSRCTEGRLQLSLLRHQWDSHIRLFVELFGMPPQHWSFHSQYIMFCTFIM